MRRIATLFVLAGVAAWLVQESAWAAVETRGFYNITDPSSVNALDGEMQLQLDYIGVLPYVDPDPVWGTVGGVSVPVSDTQVLFIFRNLDLGPDTKPMSICDVYFDDGSLLGIAAIIDDETNDFTGVVDFEEGASPGDLPDGNTMYEKFGFPNFEVTAGFLADSDPPVSHNGINPGEELGILYELQTGRTYADVYRELESSSLGPDLRVGIHVQGFQDGDSQSFVTGGPRPTADVIPEPSTLVIWSGLAAIGAGLGWRRRRKAA